jgi:hypothetical protein
VRRPSGLGLNRLLIRLDFEKESSSIIYHHEVAAFVRSHHATKRP